MFWTADRPVAAVTVGEVDLAPGGPPPPAVPGRARLLVRHGTTVLGVAWLGPGTADEVRVRAAEQVADRLAAARPAQRGPRQHRASDVTVVVCTRDRPELLVDCLAALARLDPAPGEVLVVDSASTSDRTAQVARAAGVRLVREDVPGLDRARDRGWRAATRPLVAYVDDDARVDAAWAGQVAAAFAPGVGLVTGLVLPAELATRAQLVFERDGGMAKGVVRRTFRDDGPDRVGLQTHRLGVGANMALRRDVLAAVGGFDPLLDVGTPTGGGGDLEMFSRVLHAGCTAVYEPRAFVRHVHRRDLAGWWRQMQGNGSGYSAYLAAVELRHPELADEVRRTRRAWHLQRHVLGPLRALRHRRRADLVELLAEGLGSLRGARAYREQLAVSPAEVRAPSAAAA